MKVLGTLGLLLLLQACKHPLAIIGQGDIVELNSGNRGCTMEQFASQHTACVDNEVSDEDYIVRYRAVPRSGWEFAGWIGACGKLSVAPDCRFDVPSNWTTQWNSKVPNFVSPALGAAFVPIPSDNLATERVVFVTNYGNFVIELFGNEAPITVANFLNYVDADFYDGGAVHRLNGFGLDLIQAGLWTFDYKNGVWPDSGITRKPANAPIENESFNGLSNLRGTIAMARTADPDSATSQWFINRYDQPVLDYVSENSDGYAVFGRVVTGMEVIDAMTEAETFAPPDELVPAEAMFIYDVYRLPLSPGQNP